MAQDKYLVKHNASGLKPGDKVHVVRKARSFENGWANSWNSPLNDFVSTKRSYKILADGGVHGFCLQDPKTAEVYDFPYFVLKKVVRPLGKASQIRKTILEKENISQTDMGKTDVKKVLALFKEFQRQGHPIQTWPEYLDANYKRVTQDGKPVRRMIRL